MKTPIAPWKKKARELILLSCKKWRPNLKWDVEPVQRLGDYITVTVSDALVRAETSINLRLIWKGGQRKDFGYLETLMGRLLDDFYAKHEALRNPAIAAAQAWDELVTPTEEKREIA